MGSSGDPLIDNVFRLCVILLVDLAEVMGLTYEEINVWIFVVVWPLITMALICYIFILRRRIRRLMRIHRS